MPQAAIAAHRLFATDCAELLGLDFSEKSLEELDPVVEALLLKPDAEPARRLLERDKTFSYLPEAERRVKLAFQCYCYLLEVACRGLGGAWAERKRFLRGAKIGAEFSSGKVFVALDELMGAAGPAEMMPTKMYRALKARVKDAPAGP